MVSKQPDCLGLDQPATVRSALLDRNIPRRRCAQQVRFKDLEEDRGAAPEGRTVPERHRLGAGPGSPHPNRKSPPGLANSGSVVGAVVSAAAILAKVSPHPLTPGPARRVRASPLCVARGLQPQLGGHLRGRRGQRGERGGSRPTTCPAPLQPSSAATLTADSHPGKGAPWRRSDGKTPPLHPSLSCVLMPLPCPLVSMATGLTCPTQRRRQRLGRALSDPGNEDQLTAAPPCPAPPHALPPPTAENTQWVERGGVKQAQLPLPPLPPPPPPYCPPKQGSFCSPRPPRTPNMPRPPHTPPTPRAPHTAPTPCLYSTPPIPSKVAPAWRGRIKNTLNLAPNPNPTPHQPANHSCGTTDPPLTPDQARMLKEVERLLGGLVSGARGGDGSKGGPLSDVQGLKTRLQSLEGLLETSHDTIRLLLRLIQDLELKEGQSERWATLGEGLEVGVGRGGVGVGWGQAGELPWGRG